VPYCQKYTPTDCFFGFAHWADISESLNIGPEIVLQWLHLITGKIIKIIKVL